MSKQVSCEIVKDLLPLYYDNVCSDDSKRMIEEHLAVCNNCKMELDKIQSDFTLPTEEIRKNRNDGNAIKKISSFWNHSITKSFIKGGIISALLISLIVLGYLGLFHWNIANVPTDMVEIKNVSELADGKIVYYAEINDGFRLDRLKYHMDKEGNFYITPLRPIIKQEAQSLSTLEKGYDFIDIKEQEEVRNKEIKTIYYGTPKEHILIWKKGMDLPKASEELEKMFDFK